ncbi:hypothetical protein [Sphingomicrobium sediminis]|uniref:Acetyltransferase n=1 Tax=Sphingomicrobium sediminis TaxID=2950949 RepID=A0A9X2EKV1_9SPHN|nr:hypothetical protein [Sphingomicrobium sediminis]MCM8557464.1 hypothetical protein [Sphingomicrobium sediminis]
MWWTELDRIAGDLRALDGTDIAPSAIIHPEALLEGPVRIGERTRVCRGAHIIGPVEIGEDCLIGDQVMLRGATRIGDHVRLGFCAEVKASILADHVSIGPQCFVADSLLDRDVYLGAQVRTSNHRLDKANIQVQANGGTHDSGRDKLGTHIGARTTLGIQCIILPGRIVPADSLFGPRITIEKNLPPGRYRLAQQLIAEGAGI